MKPAVLDMSKQVILSFLHLNTIQVWTQRKISETEQKNHLLEY